MGAQTRTERRFRDIQKKANNSFMRKNLKKECVAQVNDLHRDNAGSSSGDWSKKGKYNRSKEYGSDYVNTLNSVSHPTSGNSISTNVEFGKHSTGKNVALKRVSDDKKRLQKGYARLSSQGEGDCALRERYQREQGKKSRHLDLRRARKGKFDFDADPSCLSTMSFVSDSKTNEARAERFVKSACNLPSYTVEKAPLVSEAKKEAVSSEVRALVAGIAKRSVKTSQAIKRLARQEKKKARRAAKLAKNTHYNNGSALALAQPATCLKKSYNFELSKDSYDFYSKFPATYSHGASDSNKVAQYSDTKCHKAVSSTAVPENSDESYNVDYSDVLDKEEQQIAADQQRVREMVRRLEVNVFKKLGVDIADLRKKPEDFGTEFADNDWSYLSGDLDWNDAFDKVDTEGDWKMLDLFSSEDEPADLESCGAQALDSPMSVTNMGFVLLDDDY